VKPDELKELLKAVKYPGFSRDIVSFGIIKEIDIDDRRTQVRLVIASENQDLVRDLVGEIEALVDGIDGLAPPDIIVERPQAAGGHSAPGHVAREAGRGPRSVPGVGRMLAVASAKGGVGKSTVAANLAVALSGKGYRVGLLDADIYGPSIPTMFGVADDEAMKSDAAGKLIPLEREGVKIVSMGFFVGEGAPLIWRGPMLTKALTQFLYDVDWGRLDYLVLDLPPGTGDVQMTLTMQTGLDGGIIVTTPQEVALADVERGIKMFQQAQVPVLGVIENMSYHVCSCCEERTYVFGKGGGARIAERYDVPFLGEIPLVRAIREAGDSGRPVASAEPGGPVAAAFAGLAERVGLEMPVAEVGHA
jgi:ATP-binding protein involved in chromosome partitioning